jgi:glycosyltransferase involved in cell wall biosynthesis
LINLAKQLGVIDNLVLPGIVSNPRAWFRNGGFFVLSSRFEGFPNALLEAMAEGLPAVAFDCESGPREIIRDNVDGLLIPAGDVEALAQAIRTMSNDDQERKRLAQRAPEVLQRFSLELVLGKWEELIIKRADDE